MLVRTNKFQRFIDRKKGMPAENHYRVIKFLMKMNGEQQSANGGFRSAGNAARFIVRVDDFPRWDVDSHHYLGFHQIMKQHEINYVLGVTPYPCKNPLDGERKTFRNLSKEEAGMLRHLKDDKVEFALHGFTHENIQKKFHSELIGLSDIEIKVKVEKSLSKLAEFEITPGIFIPPFNSIDHASFEVLSEKFEIICGGPESVHWMGFRVSPIKIGGTIYLPSYFPAYGEVNDILDFVRSLSKVRRNIIVPLTIHWSWEWLNGFSHIESLCRELNGKVVSTEVLGVN